MPGDGIIDDLDRARSRHWANCWAVRP